MQLKTLALTTVFALANTAMATKYNVANCGKATNMDGSSTKAACSQVGAELCDRTGITRCIVDENKFGDFQAACKDNGEDQVYKRPGAQDHFTATRMAGCI